MATSPITSPQINDGLEDAPPRSGEQWTNLRGGLRGGGAFSREGSAARLDLGHGIVVHQRSGTLSEQASLHSMRSHLAVHSPQSSGSRVPSHHTGGSGHSLHTSSSRSNGSLAHSGSISSDGRHRRRRPAANAEYGRASLTAMGRRHGSASPLRNASNAEIVPTQGTVTSWSSDGTGTISGTSNTHTTTVIDHSTGAIMHFPSTIWSPEQGGSEWPDDAWIEIPSGGGARWWGPPEALQIYRAQTGDPAFM